MSFDNANDCASLQAACVDLCQKAKSDKVLLMLCECLCLWMLREKQLIPRAILRRIQEQIQKFAKLKQIALFETVSQTNLPNCQPACLVEIFWTNQMSQMKGNLVWQTCLAGLFCF